MRYYEAMIVRRVIADLLTAGFPLTVDDGSEPPVYRSTDAAAIFKAMGTINIDVLLVPSIPSRLSGRSNLGWVKFVYGNEPGAVLNDYTANLGEYLAGALALADRIKDAHEILEDRADALHRALSEAHAMLDRIEDHHPIDEGTWHANMARIEAELGLDTARAASALPWDAEQRS